MRIDIKTRVVSTGDKAFRLFPGASYRHFEAMRDHSLVFLEIPGLERPGEGGYPKSPETLRMLAISEHIREGRVPEPEELEGIRWGSNRRQTLAWANRLYHEMQRGDMIVLSSPQFVKDEHGEWVKGRSLIGEISGRPRSWNRAPARLRDMDFLVRSVRWLGEVDEFELDRRSYSALRTQNPLIVLPASSFEKAIGAAHKNVLFDDHYLTRFHTAEETFTAFESFHFNAFTMAVAAAYECYENGGEFDPNASIYEIAASLGQDSPLVPDQFSMISSPGFVTLKSLMMVPVLTAALFGAALGDTRGPVYYEGDLEQAQVQVHAQAQAQARARARAPAPRPIDKPHPEQVQVVNSSSVALDPCEAGIEDAVRGILDMMGYNQWQQLCEAARKASDQQGLRPAVEVEADPPAEDNEG